MSTKKFKNANSLPERLEKVVLDQYDGVWADFMRSVGIKPGSADRYKKGIGKPGFDQLVQICEVTRINPAWLLTGDGRMYDDDDRGAIHDASLLYIPRVDVEASAGGGSFVVTEEIQDFQPFKMDEIKRMVTDTSALAVIKVRGESMYPTLSPGDDLVIDMGKGQTVVDGVYAIRVDDTLMVKRIQHLPRGIVVVKSDNPSYETFKVNLDDESDFFMIVGRVIWAGKRF